MTFQLTADAQTYDCRKDFADELIALAREDERIVAVCNDSVGSSNLVGFRQEFPDRLVNVGIAEQDLVGVGAGLANGGDTPLPSPPRAPPPPPPPGPGTSPAPPPHHPRAPARPGPRP